MASRTSNKRPSARIEPYSRPTSSKGKRKSRVPKEDAPAPEESLVEHSTATPVGSSLPLLSVFIDGACSGNPGVGGWGVFAEEMDMKLSGGSAETTTNNRMELTAAIEAMKWIIEYDAHTTHDVTMYTDSEYVQKGITSWIIGWRQKQWRASTGKSVLNQDLWKELDGLAEKAKQVKWQWVKAHGENKGNNIADGLAKKACPT